MKKTRAILQVVGADNGRGLAKSAKRLRAINRRLSALRDADVMLETLHTLRIKDRGILNGTLLCPCASSLVFSQDIGR